MIFSSSTDLANWLNINYQDINKWWKSKQIQRIRKDLVKKFSDEIDLVKYKKYSDIINLSEITLNGRNG